MATKVIVTFTNEHVEKWLESKQKHGLTAQEIIRDLAYNAMMAENEHKSLADKVWKEKRGRQ